MRNKTDTGILNILEKNATGRRQGEHLGVFKGQKGCQCC